ncbi:hypothetical protein [Amycolatopsis sp. NPDC049159]|uniref:hypothetical protein n=1 Tax=Amycolatopsis sp. NPDC049159 TaxID=3157210 RepID=UPI0033FC461E
MVEKLTTGGIEIVTSATKRGGDVVNAGRILVRALVVIGGAVALSAVAWLTATAFASTITQIADGPGTPAVVTVADDLKPPTLSAVTGATPSLVRVRDLSRAVAHTDRLVDVLEANVTDAVASTPATVLAVGRIAVVAADSTTGLVGPADDARDLVEHPPAGPGAAGPEDSAGSSPGTGPKERPAGHSSAIAVGAATAAIASESRADQRADLGAGGPGRSTLPSCVVPASTGLAAGHDRSSSDAVQPPAAAHPRSSHSRNGVSCRAVTSTEIQPGVTPD